MPTARHASLPEDHPACGFNNELCSSGIYCVFVAVASPRGWLGWTCPPHFCQRVFLRLMQICWV